MKRILLVEDEAMSRLALTELLTGEGYLIEAVVNGEEALKMMKSQSFDAVLTDYKQPGKLNGIDVLTEFECLNPGRTKLLMTAYLPGHAGEQAVGAIYVAKPIDLDDLLTKLKSLLS